jgi:hypothetical protein
MKFIKNLLLRLCAVTIQIIEAPFINYCNIIGKNIFDLLHAWFKNIRPLPQSSKRASK